MSEQLKTPVPPSEFIEHDDSEVSAPTGRDILDLAERKGGEIEPRIKYLDAVRGGLNIVADTTVTSSTQASEANEISKTTRPTLIAETEATWR